jgi:hypothetical protein
MKGCGYRDSCREHFRDMYILPLKSHYIYYLMMFIVKNREIIDISKVHYEINTRHITDIHMTQANLSIYKKGAYYSGVKIFNKLPSDIKNVNCNITKFKTTLKKFLCVNSFYTLEEYF